MPIGRLALRTLWSVLALACLVCGAQPPPPAPPAGLPTPPPLSPELLKRRPPEPPPNLPDPAELMAQLRQLGELLELPPERLAALRQTIEYLEKMTPQEREAMRIRLRQATQMTPALRAEINAMAGLLPPEQLSDLSQFWLAATDAERQSIRDQLASLEPDASSRLLTEKISAFIQRRDAAFEGMKAALEAKKRAQAQPRN